MILDFLTSLILLFLIFKFNVRFHYVFSSFTNLKFVSHLLNTACVGSVWDLNL